LTFGIAIVMGATACGSDSGSGGGSEKSGSGTIGITSPSISYVPLMMAVDRVKSEGYDVELKELGDTATLMQAASAGSVDVVSASTGAVLPALDAGLDMRIFVERVGNEYSPIAKKSVATCAGLNGARFGIDSRTDVSLFLAQHYLAENCPDAKPKFQVVPSSENRTTAMLQGQLDGSVIDLENTLRIQAARPGAFVQLADYFKLPLVGGVVAASPDWLSGNKELAEAFIRALLETEDEIYKDPSVLIDAAKDALPEVDPADIDKIAQAYLDAKLFDPSGDLTDESVNFTIDLYDKSVGFKNIKTPSDIVDRSYLDEVRPQ
jgi:ABC-type nitrate/sulfonate/bicarbonate transport system substrate-binding protein